MLLPLTPNPTFPLTSNHLHSERGVVEVVERRLSRHRFFCS